MGSHFVCAGPDKCITAKISLNISRNDFPGDSILWLEPLVVPWSHDGGLCTNKASRLEEGKEDTA